MMRILLTVFCSLALAGCNFSDPLEFPGDPNNTPNNDNNSNNNTIDGDMGGGDGTDSTLLADLSNVRVNGEPLPTDVSSGTEFSVAADVTVMNSSGCVACPVQVLVALSDGDPSCLIETFASDGSVSATVSITAPATMGSRQLLWAAFEEADCDAAIAAAGGLSTANSLGDINFTAAPALSVIAVAPTDGSLDNPVDSEIRVSFDGPIDPTSVPNRVRLDNAGVRVAATVSVSGSEILIEPDMPLTEFQTEFTILVSAGVTGGGGSRTLESDYMSTFTTRMFVPSAFYAASNEFHAVGFAMSIDAANQAVMAPADDQAPAQRFRFVPRDDGWVAYNSAPVAATRALDGGDGTTNASMTPLSATPSSGQIWLFTRQPSGSFVVQNKRFGTAQSLDGTNLPPATAVAPSCVPGSNACPIMQPTTAINRQFWRWRRLP